MKFAMNPRLRPCSSAVSAQCDQLSRGFVARALSSFSIALIALLLLPGVALGASREAQDAIDAKSEIAIEALKSGLKRRGGVIAVAPLSSAGSAKALKLETAFGAALVKALKEAGMEVRDQEAVKKVVGESATAAQLGGDTEAMGRISQLTGAGTLLIAQLGGIEKKLVLDVKAVDPSTGRIVGATSQKLPLSLFASSAEAPSAKAFEGESPDETIEIALRRMADSLARQLKKTVPDQELRYIRAGVAPFQEVGDQSKKKELGTVVSAEIATILGRDHGILMVDRAHLRTLLQEQSLGELGIADPKSAAQVGAVLGADYLVVGTVSQVGDHFRVDGKVVDSNNASVVAADARTLPAASLIALSSESVVLRSRSGAAFRSLLIPGWGQFYNREPVKGTVFLGAELALVGVATTFHLLGQKAEKEYHLPKETFDAKYNTPEVLSGRTLTGVAEDLAQEASSDYKLRNTMLIIAGGVWAYNLLDAFLNGIPASSQEAFVIAAPVDQGVLLAALLRF